MAADRREEAEAEDIYPMGRERETLVGRAAKFGLD
jgi:hypothetical protein